MKISSLTLLFLIFFAGITSAEDPFDRLKEETLSYFKPLKGRIVSVERNTLSSDLGIKSGVRRGMRFSVLREGEPFLHPVTKEPIGNVEAFIGTARVIDVGPEASTLEITQGDVKVGDIVRISEMKEKILFYQDRAVDWVLGEHYYRLLKDSDRIDLIDTSIEYGDDSVILAEAKKKGARVALLLRADEKRKGTIVTQRLIWVDDSFKISDDEVIIDDAQLKELHLEDETVFAPLSAGSDALLFFDLPFTGGLVAAGDVNGDGNRELIITSGRDIMVYAPGTSLQSLYEIKGNASDDYLWIDAMDVNGDGKDEIIVTSLRGREVDTTGTSGVQVPKITEGNLVSYIYEFKDGQFSLLWKGNLFLRRLNNSLIAQEYKRGGGYQGPVVTMRYERGELRKAGEVKLPMGVNIYDFAPIDSLDGMRYILAYDDNGHLNLYNAEGLKVWNSKEDFGLQTTFKKVDSTVMVDRGVWTVKDRLLFRNKEALVVKRVPLASMAKGIGYKSSQVKTFFWTGLSMEERTLIDSISGSILDYAIAGDWLIVMSKPLFGIKAGNILRGESPMGSMLYIYSLTGR